jgi:succinyl-CoA synthetase beta subunit
LQQYDITVPKGKLVHTPKEAVLAFDEFRGKAILKGQVLTGGRGKAGAIQLVTSRQEAETTAKKLLSMSVKNFPVKSILVTEALDITAEYYISVTIDRDAKEIILVASSAGGMEIEEIAKRTPEFIKKFTLFGENGESDKKKLTCRFFDIFGPNNVAQAASIAWGMSRLFRDKDCSLVEINPLALTKNGLIAADAKIVFDDNGIPKHPELNKFKNPDEHTSEELMAQEAGLSFVSLDGEIGCMVNGAGLAMATMDCIKLAGAEPANFLDVGGSSNPEKVINGMKILLRNKKLKAILINIFGGITRCDDIAGGIISARQELEIKLPVVIRLIGTNEEEGRSMLEDAGLKTFRSMSDAINSVVTFSSRGIQS